MTSGVVALVVAIVGVVGTLAAAVLTQLFAIRAQRDQRREESWRTTLKERRDSCIALSVEARRLQQTLKSHLSVDRDSENGDLEQAWQAFTSRYSEARIIMPHEVEMAAAEAFGKLQNVYQRVEAGPPPDERKALWDSVDDGEVMASLRKLREASREALGSDLPLRPPKGLTLLFLSSALVHGPGDLRQSDSSSAVP